MKNDTIIALSTPPLMSAIGVLRMSGDNALEIAGKMFSGPLSRAEKPKVVHGWILDGEEKVDEVVLTCFFAPQSYTGEDTVEISCHGSTYIENKIMKIAVRHGARLAERGEFTKRAFVNGKMDLVRAEAVIDLIESETGKEAEAALSSLQGGLSGKAQAIRESLLVLSAQILAYIDYPDEGIDDVSDEKLYGVIEQAYADVCELRDSYARGRMIKNGVKVVICGRPNAGKSTLMNRIVGHERSIVTDIAGTTRDIVEETVIFADMKMNVSDTAGLHESDDRVEKIGIARATEELNGADLILYVHDLTDAEAEIPPEVINASAKKILVFNKADLAKEPSLSGDGFDGVCTVSASTGDGLDGLAETMKRLFAGLSVTGQTVMNARQYDCLVRGADALKGAMDARGMTPDVILSDVENALAALGEMTGASVSTEVTDTIFARFCVGK